MTRSEAQDVGSLPDGGIPSRAVIAASWRRSAEAGVEIGSGRAEYTADLDFHGRLPSLARPALQRLADAVAGSASAVLTDAHSRILARVDTGGRLGRMLDAVELAPGFDFGEPSVGTNALGTAIEAHRAIEVHGEEHYSERLRPFSCAGAPVRDPLTGRVEGIVDITGCREGFPGASSRLVNDAVAEIEHALLAERSDAQHVLFDEYARLAVRSREAIGAVGVYTLIVNRHMHERFDAEEQELLRAHAGLIVERRARAEDTIELSSGRRVHVRARWAGASASNGFLFLVREEGRDDGARIRRGAEARSGARAPETPAVARARAEVGSALRGRRPLVVVGESGSGKTHLAEEVYRDLFPEGRVFRVDCPEADAVIRIGEALAASGRRLLLLRHTAAVPGGFDARAVLGAAEDDEELSVLATFCAENGEPEDVRGFTAAVLVPPLRHRPGELPGIAERILAGLAPGRVLSPEAQHALARHDWPGNVSELRHTLCAALRARPVGPVLAADLPISVVAHGGSPAGSLESAERAAIIEALRATEGNRLQAAKLLGIGRATLYRKLQAYGIEV